MRAALFGLGLLTLIAPAWAQQLAADFTEMGAACGVTAKRQAGIIYLTQEFGTPQ